MPAANVTVTVVYTANAYTLTINYEYEDTSEAATSYVDATMNVGDAYSVLSPVIAGYTADKLNVSGTMPAANVTVTVVYTANAYTLTINYEYEDTSEAATSYVDATMNVGDAYSVLSPVIAGYTADKLNVSGTMPAANVTVTVVYTANAYTLTINYEYEDTSEAATSYVDATMNVGDAYSVLSPVIAGYTADKLNVSGTMPAANVTVTVVYTANAYTLTINYEYEDTSEAATSYVDATMNVGDAYSVLSPVIAGYTADKLNVSGTMPAANVTVTVVYTANAYTLTINYEYEDTSEAATSYVDATMNVGDAYSVLSPVIAGYTADKLNVSGTMPAANVTVTVVYTANAYTLTINYEYEDTSEAATSYVDATMNVGDAYSVLSPVIAGYTADKLNVSGTMPAANVTVTVVYTANAYTLTINYEYEDTSEAATSYVDATMNVGDAYSVLSPVIAGYTADKLNVSGTMPAANVTVTVVYTANAYTLTINYEYEDTSEAATSYVDATMNVGDAYSVLSPVIAGYTADKLNVSGTMPAANV